MIVLKVHTDQCIFIAWWRHQMETFSALLALCAGNSPVTGEFPAQRPVTRSFDVLFDLRLNKRLSQQSWGWWSQTPSHLLWRHCNGILWFQVLPTHRCDWGMQSCHAPDHSMPCDESGSQLSWSTRDLPLKFHQAWFHIPNACTYAKARHFLT